VEETADPPVVDQLMPAAPESDDGFVDWVRPHWSAMAHLSARLITGSGWEDVLQEALLIAWRKRDQFDPERGSARNWLLAITADRARKAQRSLARHPQADLPEELAAASPTQRDVDIERALQRLTDRQRLAVSLFYYIGLPVAEIATVMGCSPGTVKSTLSDARGRLRIDLDRDERGGVPT
jgi:RNA polymerase sigma factor (sigma-70 family)